MCIAKCLIFLEVSVVDFFSRARLRKTFFFSVCLKFLAECSAGRQCGENKYKQLMKCTFREIMTQLRGRVDFSLTCREPFSAAARMCVASAENTVRK